VTGFEKINQPFALKFQSARLHVASQRRFVASDVSLKTSIIPWKSRDKFSSVNEKKFSLHQHNLIKKAEQKWLTRRALKKTKKSKIQNGALTHDCAL
jgi:hypothetical protein